MIGGSRAGNCIKIWKSPELSAYLNFQQRKAPELVVEKLEYRLHNILEYGVINT